MTDKNLATILKRKRKAVLVELLLTARADAGDTAAAAGRPIQ